METYRTVSGSASASYEEKKSEFISHISFADTEQAALDFLEKIRTENRTARHNVYAYVLREGSRTRCSDDGEPAKTSGLPTLEIIKHSDITDCIIVTTRYFGGVLLGTGGLVRAYTEAARRAVEAAHIVTVSRCVQCVLNIEYPLYDSAVRIINDCGGKCGEPLFTSNVQIPFTMLDGAEVQLLTKLSQLCRKNADITISKPFFAPF